MSKVRVVSGAFIGHGGKNVQLVEGDEYDHDHPLVLARPEFFGVPGPVRATETVGEIIEDGAAEEPAALASGPETPTTGMTSESAAPLVRRGRKPRAASA